MKRNVLILMIVLTVGLLSSTACGRKDDIDLDRAQNLWEQQVILIDNYIGEVEKSTKPEVTVKAMDTFARGLDDLIPRLNELFAKYPAFKERVKKESGEKPGVSVSPDTQKKQEAMLKLIAVGLFTESLVKMKEGQLKAIPQLDEAQKRLLAVQGKLKLDDALKKETGVDEVYNRFVQGQVADNSNPRVEKFFEKMRRASITSRLKITMRNMYILGLAIESFKADYSYVPDVSEVDQLRTYGDFVGKYLSRYIKPGQPLPLDDGWGNYLYYKFADRDYWIGSGGSDGKFSGFDQKGVYTDLENNDVIYSNAKFVYLPRLDEK